MNADRTTALISWFMIEKSRLDLTTGENLIGASAIDDGGSIVKRLLLSNLLLSGSLAKWR